MNQSGSRRALLVLEHLTGHPDGLGLTDICEALALPKSIGHRLLALLIESGYAVQHPQSGRYALTLKITMLGLRHYVRSGLDDLAQPILDQLASETGELARLAVVEGERLIWVAKAQGARSGLRYDPGLDHDTGHDVVLHATATGKAWLATLPEVDALRIVAASNMQTPPIHGRNIAKNLDAFQQKLQATRLMGYGIALDEGEPGTAAVAVAVVDAHGAGTGSTVGTLSLAGPMMRFGEERRALYAACLAKASEELGNIWPLRNHRGLKPITPASTTSNAPIQSKKIHVPSLTPVL